MSFMHLHLPGSYAYLWSDTEDDPVVHLRHGVEYVVPELAGNPAVRCYLMCSCGLSTPVEASALNIEVMCPCGRSLAVVGPDVCEACCGGGEVLVAEDRRRPWHTCPDCGGTGLRKP